MELPTNHASTGMEETKARFLSGPDYPPQPFDTRLTDTTTNHDALVHTVINSNPLAYLEPELDL